MNKSRPITIGQYYAGFKSLAGAFAGLTVLLPLVSDILPAEWAALVFPPLATMDVPARFGTMALAFALTFVFYFAKDWQAVITFRQIGSPILIAVVCLCVYLVLHFWFVRKVDIQSLGTSVYVTVGYERTEFAIRNLGSASDWELLRLRGTDEEEIRRLWTPASLVSARLLLFVSYCGFILSLVSTFSLGVIHELREKRS